MTSTPAWPKASPDQASHFAGFYAIAKLLYPQGQSIAPKDIDDEQAIQKSRERVVVFPSLPMRSTMAEKSAALLPCPFCGGEAVHRQRHSWPKTHWVQCRSCRARGPDGLLVADDADRGWNIRAASPSQSEG